VSKTDIPPSDIRLLHITTPHELPGWMDTGKLAAFLHTTMGPYGDTLEETRAGLAYALSQEPGKGGFILLAVRGQDLTGALVMLHTGMHGYIPEHLLLYISVAPHLRGQGIGQRLIEKAIAACEGTDIKLHVEPGNPAQQLYERMGFKAAYIDMRYKHSEKP